MPEAAQAQDELEATLRGVPVSVLNQQGHRHRKTAEPVRQSHQLVAQTTAVGATLPTRMIFSPLHASGAQGPSMIRRGTTPHWRHPQRYTPTLPLPHFTTYRWRRGVGVQSHGTPIAVRKGYKTAVRRHHPPVRWRHWWSSIPRSVVSFELLRNEQQQSPAFVVLV